MMVEILLTCYTKNSNDGNMVYFLLQLPSARAPSVSLRRAAFPWTCFYIGSVRVIDNASILEVTLNDNAKYDTLLLCSFC